ncbi:phosphoenolpyruvate--protein phosphotransferase [Sphingomonas sp. 1P08PE]|uniref:phosphoenolpyruvate--protein phosphotransferase n=1 Tax=Sphingomonas sp. 1P08PE TaxID=554122 RepID=UPI0039A08C68
MSGGGALVLAAPLAGWAMPLGAVPDPVFAEGMMGGGIAIDPTGDTLHAPCDAVVIGLHAARHAVTLRHAGGAELLMHIGIDSVAMAGEGFTPLVAAGDTVVAGQPLIRFDLDLIVRRARAAVTPILSVADGFAVEPLVGAGPIALGAPLLRLVPAAGTVAPAGIGTGTVARSLVVALPHGLHARPAARIAAAVRGRDAVVTLGCGPHDCSALSITGLLGLGAVHGATVTIHAQGSEAEAAAAAIAAILTATVDPDGAPAPPPPTVGRAAVAPGLLGGIAAAAGLAIGTVRWLRPTAPVVPELTRGPAVEQAALDHGLATLRRDLDHGTGVMAAHRAMLDDPALLAALVAAVATGHPAAAAALAVTGAQAAALARSTDPRIAERGADLIDIGQRLAHAVMGTSADAIDLAPGTILLADDLLPSQLAAIDPAVLAGIALVGGGPTAHVAIMAAGSGIPMVVAIGAALAAVPEGRTVVLDGDGALLDPAPDTARLAAAQRRLEQARTAEAAARATAGRPAATRDGHPIAVHVNLGTVEEAVAAVAAGAEGCGLLRTELLFLDRADPPSRAGQADEYRAIAAALAGRPLTVRLLDIGGDKPAPYLAIPPEENPALGLRGVRVLLARPALLADQLAAILDAADAGPCRIMVPMVAGVDEMVAVRTRLDALRGERAMALGAMVETPAAAIAADLIAAHCDFLSIGSNDLTQYALAMDRGNPAVAATIDGLHPAVLRLIAATCQGAVRHGVPVGVCGGLAADPLAVPILVGLGVTSLSVPAGRVAATRALVAGLSLAAARDHAQAAMQLCSADRVRDHARRFAAETASGDAA